MAAIFYTSSSNDVFRGEVEFKAPINVSILGSVFQAPGNLAIVTSIGVQLPEVIQFFLTFDDVIHYLFFGKGLGNLNISGVLFCDCSGSMPGMSSFLNSYGSSRGQKVQMSIGSVVFEGIISNLSLNVIAEPDTMMEFNLQVSIVKNSLPSQTGTSGGTSRLGSATFSGSTGGGLGGTSGSLGSSSISQRLGTSNSTAQNAVSTYGGYSGPSNVSSMPQGPTQEQQNYLAMFKSGKVDQSGLMDD